MFRCGSAKIDITPPAGIALAGMGKGNFAKGIHDRLYARAIVLNNGKKSFALVSSDLVGIDKEITEKIKRQVKNNIKIPSENIIITATHNHYGPNTRFILPYPDVDRMYIKELCEKIVLCISDALNNLEEAEMGVGRGVLKENVNRRSVFPDGTFHFYYDDQKLLKYFTGPCDYEVGVLHIRNKGNRRTIGTLINYTCHPICLPANNDMISADYPGVTTRIIEEKTGGIALFTNGACGNVGPVGGLASFERVEKLGKELAEEVEKVIGAMDVFKKDIELCMVTESVLLPVRKDIVSNWDLNKRFQNKKSIKTEIKIFAIDNCVFVGIPAEPFVELGLEIKRKSPFGYTYVLYLTNDDLLYIPAPQSYKEGGYEVSVAMIGEGGYEKIIDASLKGIKKLYEKIHI